MEAEPKRITIAPGTNLNFGVHEDSDFLIADEPTTVEIVGPLENGAVRVRIVEKEVPQKEVPQDEIIFFHQPEVRDKKERR